MTSPNRLDRRNFLMTAAAAGAGSALAPAFGNSVSAAAPTCPGMPDIKITDVVTYLIKGAVFVEVQTDAGISGWGEVAPDNRHAAQAMIESEFKERVVGESPFDSSRLWQIMFYKNHDLGPGGVLTNAISGVDLALWDLKGKLLGQPVHNLVGGAFHDKVMVYGSFGIGNDDRMSPADAARQAAKFVEMGFKAVKCRIQIREINLDPFPDYTLSYVKAVREAIGDDIGLLIDINNGYTANRAVRIGKQLEEYGVWYMEDPVSDQTDREMREVTQQVDIPIIAGEKEYTIWQFRDLIVEGNPDVLNPDILKDGGLTPMMKIAALAEAYQKKIIPHNTRPTIGTAASLQFFASIPNAGPVMEYPDIDNFPEMVALFPDGFLEFSDGYMTVPKVPGLGLSPNRDLVKKAVEQ